MYQDLPRFAVVLDEKIKQFEHIYVIGDLHDSADIFQRFLLNNHITFVPTIGDAVAIDDIANYYIKPSVLLVFLGDILYKTKRHFKSIARFILNNKDNCILILGNNEVKFVYEHIGLFLDIAKPFLQKARMQRFEDAIELGNNHRVINEIYSTIAWLRNCHVNNRYRHQWLRYYNGLHTTYQSNKENCENLMILMYILTESIVMGVSYTMNLVMLHAGLNPNRKLHEQRVSDICNIRTVKGTDDPWFWFYGELQFTVLYGHWSALTVGVGNIEPYFYDKTICLDTGCYNTNVLTYLYFSTNSSHKMNNYNTQVKVHDQFVFYELSVCNDNKK